MFVIGLTGGIASGKSTAAALLEELGAQAIDADLLGHRAYERGTSGFERVVEAFGRGVVGEEGAIDRRALSERVNSSFNRTSWAATVRPCSYSM